MTPDDNVEYETKRFRAIRGMGARAIKKWEAEGWEVLTEDRGKLQSEIIFRRPKPKSRRSPLIVGGAVLALILATVITIGALSEDNTDVAENHPQPPVETTSEPSAAPSVQPSQAEESPAADDADDKVLTPETSPELSKLLTVGDYCSEDVSAFATKHRGETIAFPGHVVQMAPHEGATTRYDFLIGAGDYDEASEFGPAFQFRDVNASSDLRWTGATPESIGIATKLSITASVGDYEEKSCLLLLEPVATAAR